MNLDDRETQGRETCLLHSNMLRGNKSHLFGCVWCYFDSFDNFSWFDIIIVIEVKENRARI